MISSAALDAIAWLFDSALRQTSAPSANDDCQISRSSAPFVAPEGEKRLLAVLNISSYLFRIVTLFDFATDAASARHMATLFGSEPILQDQALSDACTEFVNRVCGRVNNGLVEVFRHSGMSTPFVLESTCAAYIDVVNPAQVLYLRACINDSMHFNLAVCICVASDSTLDFKVNRAIHTEQTEGEMELF